MKIFAHCIAKNASISPSIITFKIKDYDVSITSIERDLMLRVSKTLSDEELKPFTQKLTSTKEDFQTEEEIEQVNERLETRLTPYKLILTEAAKLCEGLFSLFYVGIPPHFDINRTTINLHAQTSDEQEKLNDGTISKGLGYVLMPDKCNYKIDSSIYDFITPSLNHLPALSFFSNALRSLKSNDHEVAFFLFFRIIDGYFSFGAKDVEKELLKREADLSRFIPYDGKLIDSLKSILTDMGIPSKSNNNFAGVITDLVLIRHKLTHFSSTKSQAHHSAIIIVELTTVNTYLYNCCFNLLREKLAEELNLK